MNAVMTQPVLNVIADWTGVQSTGCPWFAFFDPFIRRVLEAYPWFDKGQLDLFEPSASHRLVEGVACYSRMLSVVQSKKWEEERENAKREHERSMKQVRGGRG